MSVADCFREMGYQVEFKNDLQYKKFLVDKDGTHSSSSHILRANDIYSKKPVMLKFFCTKNPTYIDKHLYSKRYDNIVNYLNNMTDRNEGLLFEANLYRKLSKYAPYLARNLIQFVDFQVRPCVNPAFADLYNQKFATKLVPQMFFLNVLVTEFSQGKTLRSHLETDLRTDDELIPVIFQILYMIRELSKIGIQHNDLHAGNIFISDSWGNSSRTYIVEGRHYIMPVSSLRVLFFDWDLGNNRNEQNKTFDSGYLCKNFGICGINERCDVFYVTKVLLREIEVAERLISNTFSANLKKFLKDVPKSGPIGKERFQIGTNPFRLCNLKDGSCTPYAENEPQEILDATQLILTKNIFAHSIFDKYLDKSLPLPVEAVQENKIMPLQVASVQVADYFYSKVGTLFLSLCK